ncbi:hypothetical protein ACWJJH_04055 [Endozoicomonadaceae bacterium StTr2]
MSGCSRFLRFFSLLLLPCLYFPSIVVMDALADGAEISVTISQSRDIFVRLFKFRDDLRIDNHIESPEYDYVDGKKIRVRVWPAGDHTNPSRVIIQLICRSKFQGELDKSLTGFLCESRTYSADKQTVEVRQTKYDDMPTHDELSLWSFNHMATDELDCDQDEFLFVCRPHIVGDLQEKHEGKFNSLTWRVPKLQLIQTACGVLTSKSQTTTNGLQLLLGNQHSDPLSGKITYNFVMPAQNFDYSKSEFGYLLPDKTFKVLDTKRWGGSLHATYQSPIHEDISTSYIEVMKRCERGMSVQFMMYLTARQNLTTSTLTPNCRERFILDLAEPKVTVTVDDASDILYTHLLHFESCQKNQELTASFDFHGKRWDLGMMPAGSDSHPSQLELYIKPVQAQESEPTTDAKGWEGLQGFMVYYQPLTALECPKHGGFLYVSVSGSEFERQNALMQCWPVQHKHLNHPANFDELVIRPVNSLRVKQGVGDEGSIGAKAPFLSACNPESDLIYTLSVERHTLPLLGETSIPMLWGSSDDGKDISFTLDTHRDILYLTINNIPSEFNQNISVGLYSATHHGDIQKWQMFPAASTRDNSIRLKLCKQIEVMKKCEGEQITMRVVLGKKGT